MRQYVAGVLLMVTLAVSRATSLAQNNTATPVPPQLQPITAENADRLEELATLQRTEVFSLAWSPNGEILAVNSFDEIWLYDIRQLDSPPRLIQAELVRTVAFSPDGSLLASGGLTKKVELWDAQTGEQMGTLEGHEHGINAIAFSPDGSILASVDGDLLRQGESSDFLPTENNTLRLWDVDSGEQLAVMRRNGPIIINTVAFDPGGATVFIADDFLSVRGWDIETFIQLIRSDETSASMELNDVARSLTGSLGGIYKVAFSPDGEILAACGTGGGGFDGFVWLWNLETGDDTPIHDSYDHVLDISFNADGTLLAFIELKGVVHLWDIEANSEIILLERSDDVLVSVAFSPDGSLLATGSREGVFRLWGIPAT